MLQGSESKYSAYSMSRLAVVSADGGPVKVLTEKFDRGVSQQVFSEDGKSINVLVADDRLETVALLAQEGRLGATLRCVLAYERGDWETVENLGCPRDLLVKTYLEALRWATAMHNTF